MVIDPLSSGDRVQLLEVYARSVMLLELGRCAEWANLFAPQAAFRYVRANETSPVEFRGREELLALGQRLMRGEFDLALGNVAVSPLRARHHLSNVTLFGGGHGQASGYAFLTVATIGGTEPPRWLASGMYSDSLFKNPAGCWCFESRTFTADPAVIPVRAARAASY